MNGRYAQQTTVRNHLGGVCWALSPGRHGLCPRQIFGVRFQCRSPCAIPLLKIFSCFLQFIGSCAKARPSQADPDLALRCSRPPHPGCLHRGISGSRYPSYSPLPDQVHLDVVCPSPCRTLGLKSPFLPGSSQTSPQVPCGALSGRHSSESAASRAFATARYPRVCPSVFPQIPSSGWSRPARMR